jgi:hypothetical protein
LFCPFLRLIFFWTRRNNEIGFYKLITTFCTSNRFSDFSKRVISLFVIQKSKFGDFSNLKSIKNTFFLENGRNNF